MVLLLPAPLERFILRETARDLLRAPGVVALEPPRVRYGALGRLPPEITRTIAARQAKRMRLPGLVAAVLMFHPLQLPLAEALLARYPDAVLWYARWDRYEEAYDASPALRARLADLHARAAERADWVWAVSDELVRLERAAGREAELLVPAHDEFPAVAPGAPAAVSLGHLGWRTDWALVRSLAERLEDLTLLLVGEVHPDEMQGDADFAACRELPGLVWLGRLGDAAAARVAARADVGIVPFRAEPFNDAGLPQRIVKCARQGRCTLAPDLAGVRTLARAVTVCPTLEDWERELRAAAGTPPDPELQEWALAQTAAAQNAPLWARLRAAGVSPPRPR